MMYSVLKKHSHYLAAVRRTALVFAVIAAGCEATVVREPAAPMQERPIAVDEAMQHRDWSTSVAVIPSGATVAGPTLFAFQPAEKPMDPPLDSSMFEIPIFLGNIAVLPIVAIAQPPWTDVAYHGVNLAPSYTMSPAYPEDIPTVVRKPKAGAQADVQWARHYRKGATSRPVF